MNSSIQPAATPHEMTAAQTAPRPSTKARTRSSWLISLTAVCFLFGGLMAMQLRAIETASVNRAEKEQTLQKQQALVAEMKTRLTDEAEQRQDLQTRLDAAIAKIKSGNTLSQQQIIKMKGDLQKMQLIAGLTPVTGPGIVIKLSDNKEVADAGALPGSFAPGIVHDFDVLQVVNELRSAKAEAISVNDTRVTAYTPIRCVGPTILINWDPAAAPFIIKAIGDPDRLASAVSMPNGIVENLRNNTLGVKVSKSDKLELPAADGVPTMDVAKENVKAEKP